MTAKTKAPKLEIKVDKDAGVARVAFGEGNRHSIFIDGEDEGGQNAEGEFNANVAKATLRENADYILGMLLNTPNVWAIVRADDRDYVAMNEKANEIARDPELEDLFTTLTEEGGEDEEGEDEGKGSVVPDKYKKIYAEASESGTHCGDWLADQLEKFCVVPVAEGRKKTMTDLDRFESICVSNGVDGKKMAALRTDRPGWQGRFRMTGRNLLTTIVAAKGVLFVPQGHNADSDMEVKAPRQWCLDNAPKPKAEKKAKAKADVKPAKGKGKAAKEAAPAKAKRTRKAKEVQPA